MPRVIHDRQELAAPDRAVHAVTRSVPGDAERGPRDVVLGETRHDVREMVLHRGDRQAQFARVSAGEVIGMQIGDDRFGRGVKQSFQIAHDAIERFDGLRRLEIAQMLADEHIRSRGDGHGALQMRADGDEARRVLGQPDRQRRIPTRAAQNHLAPRHDPHDGVVDVAQDGPVVHQERVGDARQAHDGVALVRADRFVRQVAARRDDRRTEIRRDQMMERRVGQHHAQRWRAWSD